MIALQEKFMREAIRQAEMARAAGDYAIGAVIVHDDRVIAACSSRSKRDESPVVHAETLALVEASKILKSRHLPHCILYTTHEPCPMCASVAVWARIKGIVYGARTEDMAAYRKSHTNPHYLWRTIDISCEDVIAKSTEKVEVVKDFLREECVKLFHS